MIGLTAGVYWLTHAKIKFHNPELDSANPVAFMTACIFHSLIWYLACSLYVLHQGIINTTTQRPHTSMRNGKFYGGTSGLVLPYKNRSFYPPQLEGQSRLQVYGSLFNSIEINSSFYKVPQAATVLKWAGMVPADFRFTYKLWQGITHQKTGAVSDDDVSHFMQVISGAGKKKGCLLIQFPPGLRYTGLVYVQQLLEHISEAGGEDWKVAVEFRHTSWYRAEAYRLLNKYKAALVYHDKTGSQSPLEEMDASFIYLRFHGPGGDYRGSYEEAVLSEYAGYVRDWLRGGKDVYCYFNNTIGDAIGNLKMLSGFLH